MDVNNSLEMFKNMQPVVVSYGLKFIAALLIFFIGKWFEFMSLIRIVFVISWGGPPEMLGYEWFE
jgi:hypothetical protein